VGAVEGGRALAAPAGPAGLVPGAVLGGRYRLEAAAGGGGMGTVYRATDLHTGGPVAVKVPHPHLARRPVTRERLRREAYLAAVLTSPRVVRVLDLAEHEGVPFLVTELVAGEALGDRLRREGRLPPAEALAIAREVALALAAAHARGILHRDLTPGNVMLAEGRVKLMDFGVAAGAGLPELTEPGGFVGTPAYAAPERFLGGGAGGPGPARRRPGGRAGARRCGAPPRPAPAPGRRRRR
jgi:serine/threonine protein kinase